MGVTPTRIERSPDSVEKMLSQAGEARRDGRPAEERRLLESAIDAAPGDPRVLNALGLEALRRQELDEAVRSFSAAWEADPDQPALLINLATALRAKGDVEAEREALKAALALDRLQITPQLRLAELFEREGDLTAAAGHWDAVAMLAGRMAPRPAPIEDALRRAKNFLAEHNERFDGELMADLGGTIPSDWGGRRFRACVDHMLGKRRIYVNECAGIHYPFLPVDEFFDDSLFPWFAEIEPFAPSIRDEALALLADPVAPVRPYVRQDPGTPENKWTPLDGSRDWSSCFVWEYGVRNDPVAERCPATMAMLERVPQSWIPGKAPSVFFSALSPGARIPPHTGVTNTRAVVHLPLVVPPKCALRVGGETREWIEGKAVAFDDTIEHEAWNSSDETRIVLILDVWNPHLSEDEQRNLTKLFAVAHRGLKRAAI